MESLFLRQFPPPNKLPHHHNLHHRNVITSASISSDSWSLSSGNDKPYRRSRKKPLTDDDARRIIDAKAKNLRLLRRKQGSGAMTPRWIQRTPEQMVRYVEGDRDGQLYGKHVVAAIRSQNSSPINNSTYHSGSFIWNKIRGVDIIFVGVLCVSRVVRELASRPVGSYDMREVMRSFVAKLTFRFDIDISVLFVFRCCINVYCWLH